MKKSISILILSLLVLILFGISMFVIITSMQNDFVKSFKLQKNGITQEKFQIDGLELKPGDNTEYQLKYSCIGGGNYDLAFEFNPINLGGMEKYVVVEVESSNRKVSVPLQDLLEDKTPIELTITLKDELEETVYLRFIMPIEVGNEAQRTTASFSVGMTAKHHSEEFGN